MTLEILTLFSDNDGSPRLGQHPVRFRAANLGLSKSSALFSEYESGRNFTFVELPVGFSSSYRIADLGQVAVCLDGQLDISTGEGESRAVGPGCVFRLLPGCVSRHRISVVGNDNVHLMVIQTSEEH